MTSHSNPVLATSKDIRAVLANLNRDPFLDTLALIMSCTPSVEDITAFAADHPDRWANAVSTFARLGGFHDKLEITNNINISIQKMGDAELLAKWEEGQKNILDLTADTVEVEDVEIEEEKVSTSPQQLDRSS